MKLNPDCIREVLMEVESIEFNAELLLSDLCASLKNFSEDQIEYTCIKLEEAGLIKAMVVELENETSVPVIFDLTYAGHEFLSDTRSNKMWETVKSTAGKIGAFSLKTLSQIAAGVIQAMITQQINSLPPQ